jgi:DNA invertase Pin-like site-specific DNA recombinase
MLDKLKDDIVVVTKLDRLGRDAVDVLATIQRLGELEIKVIVLQLGQLDLTSPAGRMMLTMFAAVAEMERDLLLKRNKAGLERARAEGKTLGRPRKTTPRRVMRWWQPIKPASRLAPWRGCTESLGRPYSASSAALTLQISAA